MQINLLTSKREEVEAAFVEMEGAEMLERTGELSLSHAFEVFPKMREEFLAAVEAEKDVREKAYLLEIRDEVKTHPGSHLNGTIIYGHGGYHRYYVRDNGHIEFSTYHASNKDNWDKAEKLGFRVVR